MQSTTFTCHQCGAPLQGGMIQCPNCGMAFAAPVPLPQTPGDSAPPSPNSFQGRSLWGIIRLALCLGFLIWIFQTVGGSIYRNVREKQINNESDDRMKALGQAALAYARDHNGTLPPTDSMDHFRAAVGKYLANGDDSSSYASPDANVYYWLNPAVSQKKLVQIARPDMTELAEDTTPRFVERRRGYHIVLYLDGHVHVEPVFVGSPQP